MPKKLPATYELEMEFEGKKFTASYFVDSGVVTVSSGYGSQSTLVGGSQAKFVARMLFRELLEAAKKSGEI